MSNKERGSHGNCYCTFDLRVRWLRCTCRRGGDSMIITMIETLIIMSMPFLFIGAALETAGEVADASR